MPLDPSVESVFRGNLSKILRIAEEKGLDAIILSSESNIAYSTGIRSPSGAAIVSDKCGNTLVVPLLDYYRIMALAPRGFDVYAAYRGAEEGLEADIPPSRLLRGGIVSAVHELIEKCGAKKIGADLSSISYSLAKPLQEKFEQLVDVAGDIQKARSVKSDGELSLIGDAIRIAERAFEKIYYALSEGYTEASAAGELIHAMLGLGAWGEAFPPIVAFYSNTAFPHHTPTQLVLGRPGPVLVDWGAISQGYRSDMTRTWWHGGAAPERFRSAIETVLEAHDEAIDTISAGVEAWEPDNAARRVLSRAGLLKYFIHGLGHGVGVDIHEAPYLRPGAKTVLEPGMVVTVEPGVYINGAFGIRIESMVLVTPRGARVLTSTARILP
ncbi:MAG: Xaa-Pro peptidase family protein [Desulfurococcales archaeon]|nr:Xaa-Pro peptidase family protein [Desulfurococcales archaeon]